MLSYETAVKLKEKGFPQPKQKIGQFWYFQRYPQGSARHWTAVVLTGNGIEPLDGGNLEGDLQDMVYAPTAADIIRETHSHYYLQNDDDMWTAMPRYSGKAHSHENPEEAASLAYLSL